MIQNMTENDSVKKALLCNLEAFIQFRSIFEMITNSGLDNSKKKISPKVFLVQDTLGSEFMDFFQLEMKEKFDVHEIDWKNQNTIKKIEQIKEFVVEPLAGEKKEEEVGSETSAPTTNGSRKKILFLNEPFFTLPEDKKQVIDVISWVSQNVSNTSDCFFILRMLEDNIPRELIETVDFLFNIPYPTKIQRIEIFEQLLEELSITTVDITHLADLTEEYWNVKDLKRLVKMAFIQWKILNFVEFKSQLDTEEESDNNTSKVDKKPVKIPLTAGIFSNLITRNQIRPLSTYKSYRDPEKPIYDLKLESQFAPSSPSASSAALYTSATPIEGLGLMELDSFTSSQLFQYAASTKFEELTAILEKLDQAKKLDEIDRKILADYAFILKDPPNRALLKLTNAKKTIDRIQKITER